jgi:hypothetical protein
MKLLSFAIFAAACLVPLALPADEPPAIELESGDPLLESLARRFPDAFKDNPKQVTLSIKPDKAATTRASAVPDHLASLVDFRGKKGRAENNVNTITRSGNQPDLKLVALSPGDEGITVRGQPSLWWHQSAASENAEVEFILTEISGRRPKELIRQKLRSMPKGYNSLSLASRQLNPDQVALRPGTDYQWTVAVREADSGSAVFAKIRRKETPALERQVLENPAAPETLQSLSESGNWYELFDIVFRLARHHPGDPRIAATQQKLLSQAQLKDAVAK